MSIINRRSLLIGSVAMLASLPAWADDQKPRFEYIPSKLGIDYYELAPSPLAEILSQGEAEWMVNASSKYGEKAGRLWKRSISKKVSTGAISQSVIDKLRAYTPNMLTKFAVGLNPQDSKYSGLWSVGTNQVARKLASKP